MHGIHETVRSAGDRVQVRDEVTAFGVGHGLRANQAKSGDDAAVGVGGVGFRDSEVDARQHVGVASGGGPSRRRVHHQHVEEGSIVAGNRRRVAGGEWQIRNPRRQLRAHRLQIDLADHVKSALAYGLDRVGGVERAHRTLQDGARPHEGRRAERFADDLTAPRFGSVGIRDATVEPCAQRAPGGHRHVHEIRLEGGEVHHRCAALHRVRAPEDALQGVRLQVRRPIRQQAGRRRLRGIPAQGGHAGDDRQAEEKKAADH